ncbi:hypothetical protein Q5L94_02410 [Idiomarina sp. Sol25]|uniref:hypothetical protein n=1 Tax=Idiomarina sp. Sol25 TaxID=3064000 RepID=UPI00294B6FA7|nr:hypothetical protein [Idiomarina sp. Sol25]MDV6326892.1 hypothetical protein [Idiomarina sp. Sol25]
MTKKDIENGSNNHAANQKLVCQFPNPARLWLQSRLDALSKQFYHALDGLEGIITYDYSDESALYAEYRLSGYSAKKIECFQQEVGFYLHSLIDNYRSIELPPHILYVKNHRISIQPTE